MAVHVIKNFKLTFNRVTLLARVMAVSIENDLHDVTTFDDDAQVDFRTKTPTSPLWSWASELIHDDSLAVDHLFNRIGVTDPNLYPMIIAPNMQQEGDICIAGRSLAEDWEDLGEFDEISQVSARGILQPAGWSRILADADNSTGSTHTAYQIGALAEDEFYMPVALIWWGNWTSFDFIVESDDNAAFTSPVTRYTKSFTSSGGIEGWVDPNAIVGPITDDWWRVRIANVVGTGGITLKAALVKHTWVNP